MCLCRTAGRTGAEGRSGLETRLKRQTLLGTGSLYRKHDEGERPGSQPQESSPRATGASGRAGASSGKTAQKESPQPGQWWGRGPRIPEHPPAGCLPVVRCPSSCLEVLGPELGNTEKSAGADVSCAPTLRQALVSLLRLVLRQTHDGTVPVLPPPRLGGSPGLAR